MTITPPDPGAFFRDMLGQWEKAANSFGGDTLKTEEFARTMQGANAASMTAQASFHQMMEKVLAAANLPSRIEIEDLSARLARIEAALARIESGMAAPPEAVSKPRPTRGRKPPAAT